MPNLSEMFPSKFLKASDIDQDYEVTIVEVSTDTVGQGDQAEEKFIVHFEQFDKGIVLNKTNAGLIAAQHGEDTDGWIGKKIVLTVEDVAYQGKIVPAIRVRRPARPTTPTRKPLPAGKPLPAAQAHARTQAKPQSQGEVQNQDADDSVPF
jgi:hypothetical protein